MATWKGNAGSDSVTLMNIIKKAVLTIIVVAAIMTIAIVMDKVVAALVFLTAT